MTPQQPTKKEEAADSYVANELSPYNSRIKENGRKDFLAGWDAASKQVGNVWVKASDNKFPTVEKSYSLRTLTGGRDYRFSLFVVPHAINKEHWIIEEWEWLDEQLAPSLAEENRRLREALEGLVEAVPEQTNDADWWPDELTKAFGVALAALASVSDGKQKEEGK